MRDAGDVSELATRIYAAWARLDLMRQTAERSPDMLSSAVVVRMFGALDADYAALRVAIKNYVAEE